jgi:hypothetical protein
MTFKAQHPQSLIARLFILEYIKELDKDLMYSKANEYQKHKYFYKFTGEELDKEELDMNWEYLIFGATLTELEHFMSNFLQEILEVDNRMNETIKRMQAEAIVAQSREPQSVSLMDIAKADMDASRGKIIGA